MLSRSAEGCRNGSLVLLVDRREGSHDLVAPLRKMGLEVEETTLDFGDVAFMGRGPGGVTLPIGIEFKQLRELVQSLRTERIQGFQMPGMRDTYAHSWLLVEGELLYNARGQLERRAGRRARKPLPGSMGVGELLKRTITMHLCGGLNPWWTQTRQDTLKFIEALYRTWTDTDLDKHRSHLAIYEAPTLTPVSEFRRAVKAWPSIGMRTSLAVERKFGGSIRRACAASITEWASIEITDDKGKTRRLGEKDAARIVQFLEGRSI